MKKKWLWPIGYLLLAFALLAVDIVTKKRAFEYFNDAFLHSQGAMQEIEVIPNFLGISLSVTYATNQGAAWGFFASFPNLLLFLRLAMIAGLFLYLLFFPSAKQFRLPLVLILTGAIGNVIDFFVYGHVVDMIHCIFWGYDYPVFNVADCLICVGTFLILIKTLFLEEKTA